MSPKMVRVFVGNLPPDTVEDDLKKLLKKYGTVLTVEIKRRINDVFAFVDLENLKLDVHTCLQELSWKQWKGQQLKVQLARESFLQRLARERLENSVSAKTEKESLETQHNIHNIHKGPEPCKNNAVNIEKRNNQKIDENESSDSTDSSTDSSDSEIPAKGSLKMFRGTANLHKKEKSSPKNPKFNADKISNNKINEEKEILETFEMFNDVWKDEPSDTAVKKIANHYEENRFLKQKASLHGSFGMQGDDSSQMNEDINQNGIEVPVTISQIKQAEAEERRLKALADRKKEILNKKHAIQFALASVDSLSIANRPNKKIVFNDDNASEVETENYFSNKKPKLTLFSDDEMEQETHNSNDFRIRKHYEGEKGKSLLSLQARYGNDKRFVLDERFIESDDEQEGKRECKANDTQVEREKVLRILGNVLGKEVPNTCKTKTKQTAKLMLRYDPSKPDHIKFEIKKDSSIPKAKKKKTVENEEENEKKSKEEILPVVSKERYYEVSETLRETLENKDQKFSLSAIFGEENENEGEKDNDVNLEAKPIIGRKEWPLKHFQNDSSASEDENETNDQIVPEDHFSEQNIGVRQESLFFEKNDARFTEGLEFITFRNEEYINNFDEIRHRVKTLIKHKVHNHKKNSERWRKKFGKRNKNSFPGKRLKTNFRR
ncbi:hypothetical protein R5R35_014739 [Gryllus longicercus]|uniref:RRM domain-containing protein n=1 Tax=Gryllus longicercus TaxID=2509291 RepID=A0AAN9Z8P9_9ORTH